MESFLADLNVILPVIGLDILKPRQRIQEQIFSEANPKIESDNTVFLLTNHGVELARAIERDGELFVLTGSLCKRDTGSINVYAHLKQQLIDDGILIADGDYYRFTQTYGFDSPSAAAAVVLDRNSNGRREWRVEGSPTSMTYHVWQETRALQTTPGKSELPLPSGS